ncbi:glucose-1-phosphate thymidylyltransferase [Fibrobacter sp. UWB16]|uniref:sugar phosphate nucleotidyltransferase n=1 Tax=Fibrobacter sp. UWB16 TaxID=1945874 RepID=UPI000BDDA256|nr:sugar phosphate nucleotidyltransferase [Fibrobacter sp. UWB16]SOD11527.1 glucose-1-phosphate thymidylyltransferase [Fibrobacter sp. UWB16]
MKIILPVAGKGERMRPYTNNLPKCLLPVGGRTIIDWIVADTLPLKATESIFITGYKAEAIDDYLKGKPEWGRTRTVLQNDPQGLGHAISLALPYVEDDEPILIILGDTLFKADIQALANATENILYTYKVKDPRRFGVAVTDNDGRIERLVEKPQKFVSDEALVGIYYIKDVKELKKSLQYLMDNGIRTRGEFQLTDALQMMIEQSCKFSTAPVQEWLDCGLPETLIQTNTWLLQNRVKQSPHNNQNVTIIQPCFIGDNVIIENSTIGPNVTIGNNCTIMDATLKDCIMWDNESITSSHVERQIIANC